MQTARASAGQSVISLWFLDFRRVPGDLGKEQGSQRHGNRGSKTASCQPGSCAGTYELNARSALNHSLFRGRIHSALSMACRTPLLAQVDLLPCLLRSWKYQASVPTQFPDVSVTNTQNSRDQSNPVPPQGCVYTQPLCICPWGKTSIFALQRPLEAWGGELTGPGQVESLANWVRIDISAHVPGLWTVMATRTFFFLFLLSSSLNVSLFLAWLVVPGTLLGQFYWLAALRRLSQASASKRLLRGDIFPLQISYWGTYWEVGDRPEEMVFKFFIPVIPWDLRGLVESF